MHPRFNGLERLTLVFLVLGSITIATAEAAEPLELVLSWNDPHRLVPYDLGRVTREVETVLETTGTSIRWILPNQPTLTPEFDVNVILLPSEPGGPGWNLPSDTMGACVYDAGKKQSVYIFVRNVMRSIRLNPNEDRILSLLERRDLSRSLGRVVAHELVHAVAPSLPHSSEGLMAKGLGISFLTKKRIRISNESSEAFVVGLRRMKGTAVQIADRNVR
jgi:hypothetical protein